ncbi:hypothetical protein ORS3428_28435 [Mesorhizobium sp. ORS 3428]|nr:hypothetical protein ORS3428_28435 [Mesorhizobium sp. ORS 3428]
MDSVRIAASPLIQSCGSTMNWRKPGLVGRVKFLKGEEKLHHPALKDFREEGTKMLAGFQPPACCR